MFPAQSWVLGLISFPVTSFLFVISYDRHFTTEVTDGDMRPMRMVTRQWKAFQPVMVMRARVARIQTRAFQMYPETQRL